MKGQYFLSNENMQHRYILWSFVFLLGGPVSKDIGLLLKFRSYIERLDAKSHLFEGETRSWKVNGDWKLEVEFESGSWFVQFSEPDKKKVR